MNNLSPADLYPLIDEISNIFRNTGKPFWLGGGTKTWKSSSMLKII